MAVIARKTTTYRWICTNKDLCEQIDDQIAQYVMVLSKLSKYVADHQISGIDCLRAENRFNLRVKDLRDARKMLWRRVPVVKEEVEQLAGSSTVEQTVDNQRVAGSNPAPPTIESWKPEPYVSKYPPLGSSEAT